MKGGLAIAARQVEAGTRAYGEGAWSEAVTRYEAAIEAGADGPDVFYNLGNAYYRAGEIGRSTLAFERALRRDPGDEAARANLELVRSQAEGTLQQAPDFWDRLGARTDPDGAAAVLLVGWSLACAVWILRRALGGWMRHAATAALALLLLVTAAAGVTSWACWQLRQDGWSVVVRAGELREAPEPAAAVVAPAAEGLSVVQERRLGEWVRVRAGTRTGWIEARHVEAIDR